MKTANELMRITGISYSMFNRLKAMGILPRAKVQGLGRDKGLLYSYPDEVEGTISWVLRQRKAGHRLAEIAERWHRGEVEVGELVAPVPNPDLMDWAMQRFNELHARYPDDEFVPAEIEEPFEERPNGTVVAKFRIKRVPKK